MLAFSKLLFFKTVSTCLTFFLFSSAIFSQNTTIKATVVNSADSTPLFGISVVELKTKKGTSTNDKGVFTLQTPNKNPVLQIFGVGFQTATVIWNSSIKVIKLEPIVSNLEDVVVVGYGTQKKINQTGSAQTVKFDETVNQPVTNTGQLMYGRFSGVQLTQASGLPGTDESSVTIRGVGTFGNATPLVVIDNIQYSSMDVFNSLSPADIETISVLKDASSISIYGARGANGVIVVTTKKGKVGTSSVIYNNYFGRQEVTVVPQYLDAVNFALLRNERDINTNGPTAAIRYSAAEIEAIRNGTDRDRYTNTKWSDEILKPAPIQNHYIAFSGGGGKTSFRASLGYLNQGAVVQGKFKAERYNLGLNINSNITNWLTLSSVTNAFWAVFKGPSNGPNAITGETGIINQFQRSAPTVPVYYSNGVYGTVDGSYLKVNASLPITNPILRGVLGDYRSDQINVSQRIGLKVQLHKNLSFETSGSINVNNTNVSDFSPTNATYDWANNIVGQTLVNTLRNNTTFSYRLLAENILRFNKIFAQKHEVSVLLGHSAIFNRTDGFAGSLQAFPNNSIQEFDGGGLLNPTVSGNAQEDAVESVFARVNYVFNKKYLLELNVRRDGSSKFPDSIRNGIFPSASVGWRIREENFEQQ
ncbi:MAG: SusC/RagA family TonB-linked outer membrane protein [Chitinophagaceae bacterium]